MSREYTAHIVLTGGRRELVGRTSQRSTAREMARGHAVATTAAVGWEVRDELDDVIDEGVPEPRS